MNKKIWLAFILAATALTGHCADQATPSPAESAARKANEAGLSMLKQLTGGGMSNVALSPASISAVFAPLKQGAGGSTRQQITEVFGRPSVLREELSTAGGGLSIANLLVVDRHLPLTSHYRQYTGNGDFRQADLAANPEKERVAINTWIGDHTDGEIPELLAPGTVTRDSVLVAINAILFRGTWRDQFDPQLTSERTFHASGGTQSLPTMSRKGDYAFIFNDEGPTLASIPYANSEGKPSNRSFIIIMPGSGTPFKDFIDGLTLEQLDGYIKRLARQRPREIILSMPKFEIKTPAINLSPNLKALGLTDLFDANRADLSALSPHKGLAVDAVYHQCYIKVDERGTKAAAATGALIARMSLPLSVNFDRPFMWMVYDGEHRLILFCGTFDGLNP